MRISALMDDLCYKDQAILSCVAVFLDGVKIDCMMADEEEGSVLVPKRDEKGDVIVDGGDIMYEFKKGKVEIKVPDHVLKFFGRENK